MADEITTDGNEDPQHPLWNAPDIRAPTSTTVSPRFTIRADTGAGTVPEAWSLHIMRGSTVLKKVEVGRQGGTYFSYEVPETLIPPGAVFNFKVDYKIALIWSRWAWSDDLTMDMTHQPPQPPTITEPRIASEHSAGLVKIKGGCRLGAVVEVRGYNNIKLGDATVSGTTWEYSHTFKVGMQYVSARQTLGGETSGPSDLLSFNVVEAPPAPVMIYPLEGSTQFQSVVGMRGTCKRGASVEVLNEDGSRLGFANVEDRPGGPGGPGQDSEWSFNYYRWTVGTWKVRARQTMGDAVSAPTELRTFHVR